MRTRSFSDSYISIRQQFKGEYSDRQALAAFLYLLDLIPEKKDGLTTEEILGRTEENEVSARERIAQCKALLKKKVRMTSAFRDHLMLPLVIRMALAPDAEAYLDGVLHVYETIKATYFTGSGQRLITAMVIYENTPQEFVDYICNRTYKIYEEMKKEHPVLTGQEDMAFAALIALDGEDIDKVIEEMEACYRILKKEYVVKMSPMQNVSHVLALTNEAPEEKTERYIELHNILSAGRNSNGLGPLLIVLAVLSILDLPIDRIVREVKEMSVTVRKAINLRKKIDTADIKLIACAFVAMRHLPEDSVVIYNVRSGFLKTILRTAIVTALVVAQSSLAISAHK